MIKITDLEKVYRTDLIETVAINKMSFEVRQGEFVAIMGPSGCGKSTLLNILGLLDDCDGGSFIFNGQEIAHFNEQKRAMLRKKNIGFVFQSFNLIDELTVYENVELPLIYNNIKPADRKIMVEETLEKMQIMHRKSHFPQQLSGGQQQRVAVARAVVNKPKLILADEPTGNLDSHNGNEVMDMLTSLNEAGTTIIMVTHSEHDAKFSHRIIRMLDGEKITENILRELDYIPDVDLKSEH
ncbi:ABC transporter ATP-binding protein [Arachidicoccus ginsenosidivorans]|jgi:putative ABC transport system ATP-binding protein|uniref:ABC transporter ATP-binding protein n=1 Tax=Arachidicoccus ginsenosidivorans TaxID=496057 RepID=A0A5B8VIM2_9BACT|nr:ABC transporter ATP-binding protein [Arachidicoccus ginsenosidivorans]QEC71437.1 ABC transporter ATP-binding protein [Arachidicoccus ginsenosidivorans]